MSNPYCYAVCNADSYDTAKARLHFQNLGFRTIKIDQALHISIPCRHNKQAKVEVFVFCFGSVVMWNLQEHEEDTRLILSYLVPFGENVGPNGAVFDEVAYYRYIPKAEKSHVDKEEDCLLLNSENTFTKFSVSYALAQSVKLASLEHSTDKLLKNTSYVQKELMEKGSISLSKKEVSRKIGELFNQRYSINMHNDILDTPEFFWDRHIYEDLYLTTARFQDLQPRQTTLNRRLDMIHDLYEMLSNDLSHRHSAKLEMIIIALITLEVFLSLANIAGSLLTTRLVSHSH